MQYKKKPLIIEAIQWDGTNITEIARFAQEDISHLMISGILYINTLEGVMKASVNDYIIKGIHGEFYPCKPDIFKETYVELGMSDKPILDACCGSKMFWWNKEHPDVIYNDIRSVETTLCDGREFVVSPDTFYDFRDLPYPDNSFKLVVFDPPHLIKAGANSWLATKYGVLCEDWENQLKEGFDECMRVLDAYGTLVFKWNDDQIKLAEVLRVFGQKPLFGDKRSKTHWCVFMKEIGE